MLSMIEEEALTRLIRRMPFEDIKRRIPGQWRRSSLRLLFGLVGAVERRHEWPMYGKRAVRISARRRVVVGRMVEIDTRHIRATQCTID